MLGFESVQNIYFFFRERLQWAIFEGPESTVEQAVVSALWLKSNDIKKLSVPLNSSSSYYCKELIEGIRPEQA